MTDDDKKTLLYVLNKYNFRIKGYELEQDGIRFWDADWKAFAGTEYYAEGKDFKKNFSDLNSLLQFVLFKSYL